MTLDTALTARALSVAAAGESYAVITFAGLAGWTASLCTDIRYGITTDSALTALQNAAVAAFVTALFRLADASEARQTCGALNILCTGNIRGWVRVPTSNKDSETDEQHR